MKRLNFICFFLFLALAISAQERIYRQYGTQKVQARLLKGSKENKSNKKNVEKKIVRFVKHSKKVKIPIVFHIINPSSRILISEQQVLSQLEALNRDFSNSGNNFEHPANEIEGFGKLAINTDISFCLAGETPNNKASTGINYYTIPNKLWGDDDTIKNKKNGGVEPWKTDDYLNVWVGVLADSVSGYAQMPGGSKKTDGIVIDYRFFGIGGTSIYPYDEGKTLTHLVGNYLGLYDLWSENSSCRDDYVADTPIHNSKHFGCPEYKQISLCTGFPVEMTMNFMDNTDDACQNMFTKGQKRRMQAILSKVGPRAKLAEGKIPCADISFILDDLASRVSPFNNSKNQIDYSLTISAFPNPAQSIINVKINNIKDGDGYLEGLDIFGRTIFSKKQYWFKGDNVVPVNCNSWKAGTYFFQLRIENELVVTKVIVSK